MIVTFISTRGSPGVTSWSVLAAAAWPPERGSERVVLEADTDGGVLGARYGIGVEPGVASLLAASRRVDDAADLPLPTVGRHVAEGVWLIPGPETAEAATTLWSDGRDAEHLASLAAADDRVWIVDAGRMRRAAVAAFALASRLTVVMTHVAQADLVQVPSRVAILRREVAGEVGVVMVGAAGYPEADLVEFLGADVVWSVARDDDVPTLAGAVLSSRRARRSLTWRSAIDVVGQMAARAVGSRPLEVAAPIAVPQNELPQDERPQDEWPQEELR